MKWAEVSKYVRSFYNYCLWCNTHKDKTKTGYLECHHLCTRSRGMNADLRLCPLNLIVVCQSCHTMLEPFAKVTGKLTFCTELDETIEEVKCCGKYLQCQRFEDRMIK